MMGAWLKIVIVAGAIAEVVRTAPIGNVTGTSDCGTADQSADTEGWCGKCHKDTGGTCLFGECHPWRYARKCKNDDECLCGEDECAIETHGTDLLGVPTSEGLCLSKGRCNIYTPGSCQFWPCFEWRGPTVCRQKFGAGLGASWMCECQVGYCMNFEDGKCTKSPEQAKSVCRKETGGTCSVFNCKAWRNAECKMTRCLCREGFCDDGQGRCLPSRKNQHYQDDWFDSTPEGRLASALMICYIAGVLIFIVYLCWRRGVLYRRPNVDIEQMPLG